MNRSATKIHSLRQELCTLKKQYKKAIDEKRPLAKLQNILRKKLMILRKSRVGPETGERASQEAGGLHRQSLWLYKTTARGQAQRSAWVLNRGSESLSPGHRERFPERPRPGAQQSSHQPPPPTTEFNLRGPSLKEVEEIIKAAHSASTPGPSGVPYLVYKRCPELLRHLWKILKVIWRRGRVADQWRCAEGVWIPKEENSKTSFEPSHYWVLKGRCFSASSHEDCQSFSSRTTTLTPQCRRGDSWSSRLNITFERSN